MKVLKKILKIVLIIVLVLLVLWGVANLAKFVIYPDYMQQRQNVCSIPDLNNGFIPQGITYDAESNSYIMSGYMGDGVALYVVTDSGYNLGILRCRRTQEQGYKTLLVEKDLRFEIICEFDPVILMATSHPLAKSTQLTREELARYTEIAVADANAPSLQLSIARKNDIDFDTAQHIFVSDCSAALSLLSSVQGGFMLSSPMSAAALKARSLCQCTYSAEGIRSRDILIYKNSYALSALDKAFIDELMKVKRSMKLSND